MLFKKKQNDPQSQTKKFDTSFSQVAPAAEHNDSNWLVSYADMMTLLCGFFIMLFSMSKLDVPEYDSFKAALAKQFGGSYVSSTQETAFFATQILQELGIEKKAIMKTDSYGISIVFESTVFFDTLSADLTSEGKKIISTFAQRILEREKTTNKIYKIAAEGHSDSRPITKGPFPSNWELSAARATRVIRMFLDAGYPGEQLTAVGFADTRPQNPGRLVTGAWDPEALAKNRRVVLRILEPSAAAIPLPENDKSVPNEHSENTTH